MDEDLKGQTNGMQGQIDTRRRDNAAAHAETRQYFDDVTNRVLADIRHLFEVAREEMRSEIRLVVEAILRLDEKFERLRALEER